MKFRRSVKLPKDIDSSTIKHDINCPLGIIKSVKSAKYFGVTSNKKLNFMSHIKTLVPNALLEF